MGKITPQRILLLHPDNRDKVEVAIHKRFLSRDFIYPPLGILSLAAWLEQQCPEIELQVLDLQVHDDSEQLLRKTLETLRPSVVGITFYTNQLMACLAICRLTKKILPTCKIVAGGPHLSLYPQETLGFEEIDYGIVGEGERPFVRLLSSIRTGSNPDDVPGLVYRTQGEIRENSPAPLLTELDELPSPGRHLVNSRSYHMLTGRHLFSTTAMSSRGCPHRCTFCDVPRARVRFNSAAWVAADVESCLDLGIREVHFFDDMFNQSPERVTDIARAFIRKNYIFDWSFRGRVDRMDPAMLRAAKESGCYRVYLGLESGTNRILKLMNKGFEVDMIKRGVAAARKEGLEVHGYFMVGFPTETKEEIMATFDLASKLDLDFVQFSVTTYLPGTKIYSDALKEGLFNDLWREQAKNPRKSFEAPIAAAHTVGEEEIWRLVKDAYRRFYLRPQMVWRNIKGIRSPRVLLRRAWWARVCASLVDGVVKILHLLRCHNFFIITTYFSTPK